MAYAPTLLPQQQQQQMPGMAPQMAAQPSAPSMGTPAGGVAAMVKAIMDGQDQFKQRQAAAQSSAQGAQPLNPNTTTGGASIGAPMSIAPPSGAAMPVDPSSMSGGAPMPGMPNGIDPTIQALFSPIPGQ